LKEKKRGEIYPLNPNPGLPLYEKREKKGNEII
jgi:hypothetical protein